MKRLQSFLSLAIVMLLVVPVFSQEKDDKIGTVDMQKLVQEYFKTTQTRDAFKEYEGQIQEQNKTRVDEIKAAVNEAMSFKKEAEDPSLAREKKAELFLKAENRQKEAGALQQERIDWVNRKKAALSEKANVEFGILRNEILKMVREVGEAEGYDFIFDRSGSSGANVPILSFAKDATDLTLLMLERINRDAPKDGGEGAGTEEKSE